jgi:hypothetical protein
MAAPADYSTEATMRSQIDFTFFRLGSPLKPIALVRAHTDQGAKELPSDRVSGSAIA